MEGRVIYLDVDDEITSAAARIRQLDGTRVAVVLPYGSRVATSRINFRLLARDALTHDKRLGIVSGDSATRALAASAGLPVFASVAEYEASAASVAAPSPGRSGSDGGSAVPTTTLAAVAGETVRADVQPGPYAPGSPGTPGGTAVVPGGRSATTIGPGRATGGTSRMSLVAGIAILALAGLVAAVGAYLLLPSAAVGLTPRLEAMTPLELTIVADPAASEVDEAALVVPASSVSVGASANGTFQATGTRLEETKATGVVQFQNLDFLNSNTVPAGSIVGTNNGVRFRTNGAVTVPKADIVGLSLFPGKIAVKVTAVKAGEDGNVDPNTIVVVPGGEDPIALKVSNPSATTGGTHQEFPRVTQQDVDAALTSLGAQLEEAFRTKLTDPSLPPAGTTLFPETGVLGQATPTIDPATLVGQEIQSFDLGLTADGTALAVDTATVETLAQAQMASRVRPDHQLVPGSVDANVAEGSADGQTVRFPVTVSAQEFAVLDPEPLKAMILGKSVAEAEDILGSYGTVDVSIWPDWMGTIPSLGSRVTLTIDQEAAAGPSGSPSASGSPSPAPSPSRAP